LAQIEGQPIPESHKKVLFYIAKTGAKTKYEIEKGTRINHASIHEAVKNLVKTGALQGDQIGTTRIGLPKIKYKLTFFGLCLSMQIANSRDYDEIIVNWKNLAPLLFGKWEYFKEKVGRKEAEDFFARATDVKKPTEAEDTLRNAICQTFELYQEITFGSWEEKLEHKYREEMEKHGQEYRQSFEKWIEAFRADPELKKYFEEYVAFQLKIAHNQLKFAQSLKRFSSNT